METGDNPDLVDFLTPIAKVFCTEAGMKAADLGMQVLGGYGYLTEYRVEQTYRDARITAIYEGANGIHARALVERLLQGPNARTADAFEAFLLMQANTYSEGLVETIDIWRAARELVTTTQDPLPLAHDFMKLTADALIHAIWARFASEAHQHADPSRINRLAYTQMIRIRTRMPTRLQLIQELSNTG